VLHTRSIPSFRGKSRRNVTKGVVEEMTGSRTSEKVMTKLANAGEEVKEFLPWVLLLEFGGEVGFSRKYF
jgi:hypothetical protein